MSFNPTGPNQVWAGDETLAHFSRLLTKTFMDTELVARLVNDEFVVLCVDNSQGNKLENLRAAVKNYNTKISPHLKIEYTVGTACSNTMASVDLQLLYMYADTDLYKQKNQ